jgi:hypothetical protein
MQNRGLASLALIRAISFLEAEVMDFALLFSYANTIGYYSKRGWQIFHGDVFTDQARGQRILPAIGTPMVRQINRSPPLEGHLDLRGPPW